MKSNYSELGEYIQEVNVRNHCCPVKINSKFKKVHLSQMTWIMIQ